MNFPGIEQAGLILLDFDGLLVNTEANHFKAYQNMVKARGFHLDWSFEKYCSIAHYSSRGIEETVYREIPGLHKMEPNWDVLYLEKKAAYVELLKQGAVSLMPGVEEFLNFLQEREIPRCVVTHSPSDHIQMIRDQNPLLNSIPRWFTREDYSKPKPDSECYLKAIEEMGQDADLILGFEDSPRGLTALQGTRAKALWLTEIPYPDASSMLNESTFVYKGFPDLSARGFPTPVTAR